MVLIQIIEDRLGHKFIHLIHKDRGIVHLFNHAHGHHARPETIYPGLPAIVLQDLVHTFLVIFLSHFDIQDRIQLIGILQRNIHT